MSRRTFPNARALRLAPLAAAAMLVAVAPSALATFPGRNGLIAFYSDTDAGAQIFTVRPNGHDLRQITHVDGDAVRPDWSPDGRRIAFELDTHDSGQRRDHERRRQRHGHAAARARRHLEGDPSFTPDGTPHRLRALRPRHQRRRHLEHEARRHRPPAARVRPGRRHRPQRLTRRTRAELRLLQRRSTSGGAAHQPHRRQPAAPAHAVQLRRRHQAGLGTRRPAPGVHPRRRPRRPRRLRQHRHHPSRRDRPALPHPLPGRRGRTRSSAPTRPTAAGSCSASRTTAASGSTRCTPTAATSSRSSASRASRPDSSTGAPHVTDSDKTTTADRSPRQSGNHQEAGDDRPPPPSTNAPAASRVAPIFLKLARTRTRTGRHVLAIPAHLRAAGPPRVHSNRLTWRTSTTIARKSPTARSRCAFHENPPVCGLYPPLRDFRTAP